jgi:hypothetical protein
MQHPDRIAVGSRTAANLSVFRPYLALLLPGIDAPPKDLSTVLERGICPWVFELSKKLFKAV